MQQARQQQQPLVLEVCIDSVAGAKAAAAAGAQRVELCSALCEGGVTPSHGLIRRVRAALPASMRLMVLVRCRGGDFAYMRDELDVMLDDVAACKQLGADGVVVGCLAPNGDVDMDATRALVGAARTQGLDVTFHRAFDMARDRSAALEQLVALGVPRVLTSGGQPSAQQGASAIAELVCQAAGRISIMAGGGVNAGSAAQLLSLGVRELHTSARRRHPSDMEFRAPMSLCCAPSDWEWNVTDEGQVRQLLGVLSSHSATPPGA